MHCSGASVCDKVQAQSDGRISLQSEDTTARLVLHPHTARFAVCYPLLVHQEDVQDAAQSADCTFTYIWQTQLFAEADYPQRWHFPLQLALEARANPGLLSQAVQQGNAPLPGDSADCHGTDQPDTCGHSDPTHDAAQARQAAHDGGAEERCGSPAARHSVPCADSNADQQSAAVQRVTRALASTALDCEHYDGADKTAHGTSQPSVLQRTTYLPRASIAETEAPNFVQEGTWWLQPALVPLPEQVSLRHSQSHPQQGAVLA